MKKISHIIIICSALFLILGLPAIINADKIAGVFGGNVDGVSSPSIEIPDRPSGDHYIYINKELHKDTLNEWRAFFKEEDTDVIFEDIECTVINADGSGNELAKRYMARLAENQMTIKKEQGQMAVSKLYWGRCDIFVVSSEIGENYNLEIVDNDIMEKIYVKGKGL